MADENNITTLAKRLRPLIKMAAQEMVPITPYDHGNLQGLGDDDHSQYIHNTLSRTIVAQHSFDPNTAEAPFTLGANAQGQVVLGLKADQLNRSVTAGNGLTGGGDLSADISLAVGAGAGLTVNADEVALTTPGTLAFDSSNIASGNHTHAITNSSDPGVGPSILSTDKAGVLTLVTLKTEVLQDRGITGSILINPAGDISLDPGGYDVLPVTNYEINLGAINKKYLTVHAAELWVETIVAKDTIATIGGRILVAPTTMLTRDLSAIATSFYVKHNQLVSGDRVYLEANGNVEWMAVTSSGTLQPEGDYLYSVSRNLDGSGANAWYSGDAVLNTGTTGDGYIDIYSEHSIRGETQYGPTIVGNIRTGTVYSSLVEGWAVGNLNGLYGYGVDIYGAAFGKYVNSSSFLTIEPTNGIRMMWKNMLGANVAVAQWDISGNLTIGQVSASQDNIVISSGALSLRNNTTTLVNLSSAGVISIGQTVASQNNIQISSGAIAIRNNTTERISITAAGIMTIKDSSGNAVMTFDASAGAEITKKLTMPGTGSAIAIGATPPTSATAGTGIWIDRTGFYTLVANVGQLQIDAATGALYAGAYDINQYPVQLDGNGLYFKQDGAGDELATHIQFGGGSPRVTKGEIYFYYSGGGVFNQMTINAAPSTNTTGLLYLQGHDVDVQATTNITLSAPYTQVSGGLNVGNDMGTTEWATIDLATTSSTPTYDSTGTKFYGKNGATFAISNRNRKFNAYGGGETLLAPLTYPIPRALFMVQGSSDKDLTPNHAVLSPVSLNASTYKSASPGPLYIADFNGASSKMTAALATYTSLNVTNWFSFGMWVYIDATGRSHGLARLGTTTQSWYLVWYNPGGYFEFGYWDTGGTQRQLQRTATLTTGWHFIGVEHGWSASGNNHTLLRVDSATSSLDNQAWLGMRAPAGDFEIGCSLSGSYWLDGKIATVWLTGYMPDSVGGCLLDYFNLTEGVFWQ